MQASRPNKLLLGAATFFLLMNVILLPIVFTGAVPSAVEEKFATFPLDSACGEDGNCESVEDNWATSTATRDYYAWNLANLEDVLAEDAEPRYEKKGPYTYEITSEKTLLEHDEQNGELTYNVVKSYYCSTESANSCDEDLTQLNIQFRPQLIGATGMAFKGIMDLTKVGFSSGMMNQDLNTTQAGIATAEFIDSMAGTIGGAGFGSYSYAALTAAEAAGQVSVLLPNTLDGNILPIANFLAGLDTALNSSFHPSDPLFNISLLDDLGPVAFVSMGEPDALLSELEANPTDSITVKRARAYGYLASEMVDTNGDGFDDSESIDYAQTLIRDWALYVGIGFEFQSNGGGSPYTDSEDIADRLSNLFGMDFSDVDCLNLMLNGNGTSSPLGLLAKNSGGTGFGLSRFLELSPSEAMSTFDLSQEQYDVITSWANGWANSISSLQMALLGGNGTINAKQFVNTSFGAKDPISGGFLQYSLNQGGDWATQHLLPDIELTPEQSAEILYGPLGLTTTDGALLFLYGELSGKAPPGYLGTPLSATQNWNLDLIAAAYNIQTNEARALQELVVEDIFGEFVENLLVTSFGAHPYLTQSVNSWLLGWHDPVSAILASGNASNMGVGWASLESNKTYYGSDEVVNGDGTNYTICTGERPVCEKGELLRQDGSTQLSWRNDAMHEATLGLITPEDLSGTTGGFLTGSDDKVDVSGYAVTEVICSGTDVVKGIPVNTCEASVEPTERSIQANLLKTFSLLDAMPSALPIYLGSEIEVKSEQLSGLIIAGDSTTRFYIDTRDANAMNTKPSMSDLAPVFEIQSSSMIGDLDAETMESSIVQNQNHFTYWMNFDTPFDLLPFFIWLAIFGALFASLTLTYRSLGQEKEEEDIVLHEIEQEHAGGLLQRGLRIQSK
ncbi:MAG: hypothetical protein CXT69_02000 [Methanobacteriota archaeon]|nr:MAG: hypothetical protein CXT69_02000 [Euryarchaeota archaeon]HIK78178.1 hypothetical protein [Candidatus Poseidoniales archaeon]